MSASENIDPNTGPASPPSPVHEMKKKASRRSSVAAARRLSRVGSMAGGIPFEDLLATIPKKEEASSKERLEKLLQLAVSSSLRATVDSFKTDEDEDMELVAKEVSSSVRKNQISDETLAEAVTLLDKGVNVEGELIGGELKRVKEYTESLEKEGFKWAELIRERTELVKNADRNAKAVASGEIALTDEIKWSLSGEERLRMKKTSDACSSAVSQLEAATGACLEVLLRDISTSCVSQISDLKQNEERLGCAVKELTSRADTIGNKL